jgi:hypothetical protein
VFVVSVSLSCVCVCVVTKSVREPAVIQDDSGGARAVCEVCIHFPFVCVDAHN